MPGESHRNIFEIDPYELFEDINHRLIVRPLPAVQTMLAVAPKQRTGHNMKARNSQHDKNIHSDSQAEAESRTGSDIPLLKLFFKKIEGRKKSLKKEEDEELVIPIRDGMKARTDTDEFMTYKSPLDSTSTLLTMGHHQKFKELLGIFGRNKSGNGDEKSFSHRNRKKEFRTLCSLFREERELYSAALDKFLQDNSDRFTLGFKSK